MRRPVRENQVEALGLRPHALEAVVSRRGGQILHIHQIQSPVVDGSHFLRSERNGGAAIAEISHKLPRLPQQDFIAGRRVEPVDDLEIGTVRNVQRGDAKGGRIFLPQEVEQWRPRKDVLRPGEGHVSQAERH